MTQSSTFLSPTIRLKNGVRMPLIGAGTYPLQGQECSDMIAKALRVGYRHFDTA